MCDRNVKSEYILIKLYALVFEYICERTTKFHEKILFDSGVIMRPSSLGGGRILRRTLSVRLSVCLSVRPVRVYIRTVLRAHIQNS